MNFEQAIRAYIEKFGAEDPPVMGFEEADAIEKIQLSIDNNVKIEDGAEVDLPDNVII